MMRKLYINNLKLICCNYRSANVVFLWRVCSCRGCDHSLSLSLPPCAAHWKGQADTADTQSGQGSHLTELSSVVSPSWACPHSTTNLSPPPRPPLSVPVSYQVGAAQFDSSLLIHDRYLGWTGWLWNVSQHHHDDHLVTFWSPNFLHTMHCWLGTDRPTCP